MKSLPPRISFSSPSRPIGDSSTPPNGVALAKPPAPYRDPAMVGSNYARLPNEGYMTIDADWIIPALLKAVPIEGRILEPCAGRGHIVYTLRQAGLVVVARDLFAYPAPLVPDIESGCDLREISTLAGVDWVVTNLPFKDQDEFLAHLLRLAADAGCGVAVLTRLEWTFGASASFPRSRTPELRRERASDAPSALERGREGGSAAQFLLVRLATPASPGLTAPVAQVWRRHARTCRASDRPWPSHLTVSHPLAPRAARASGPQLTSWLRGVRGGPQ
ncbi:hypothetical protein [Bosea sp. NBC_00550]|uniref:hypothetical protein n=1 Tax=Bosea sp. NBC_00550 TaxID=2969621 RepID=UPI00222F43D3|nr:hypothetical protein [Bosea sp. NBC_00550]UZF94459.1 hypothetical protein NWE53_09920 [Bosea sp. NBC_00550]